MRLTVGLAVSIVDKVCGSSNIFLYFDTNIGGVAVVAGASLIMAVFGLTFQCHLKSKVPYNHMVYYCSTATIYLSRAVIMLIAKLAKFALANHRNSVWPRLGYNLAPAVFKNLDKISSYFLTLTWTAPSFSLPGNMTLALYYRLLNTQSCC